MDDPTFGTIAFEDGAWDGSVPFVHEPSGTTLMDLHIEAAESGPTDAQRQVFLGLRQRYGRLWPDIARALASGDGGLPHPIIALFLNEFDDPDDAEIELVYTFLGADGLSHRFVRLHPSQVVESPAVEAAPLASRATRRSGNRVGAFLHGLALGRSL